MPRTVKSLKALLEDSESGSSALLQMIVHWALAEIKKKGGADKVRTGLNELSSRHSSMALLENFNRHFQKTAPTKEAIEKWMESYQQHEEKACQHFAEYLSKYKNILVHSNSGLLCRSLLSVPESLQIYCTESRPAMEGKSMAETFARSKHKVILLTDIAAFRIVPVVDLLAFGCDAITTKGVVNKIGTAALAQAGKISGKDSCFVGTSEKVVPEWKDSFLERHGLPKELYAGKQPLEVQNYYFDLTPPDLVRYVFLETGRFSLSGK
jgi:translation initiation factor 2B subunit (eIF-2B alpha/beta/delta family)